MLSLEVLDQVEDHRLSRPLHVVIVPLLAAGDSILSDCKPLPHCLFFDFISFPGLQMVMKSVRGVVGQARWLSLP